MPRCITLEKDCPLRHVLPVDVAGLFLGQYQSPMKVSHFSTFFCWRILRLEFFFGKENIFSCPFFITLRLPSAAIGSWTSPCSRRWSATSSFGVCSLWTACCWSPTRLWELSIILPLWTKTCHSKKIFLHLLPRCYHLHCFLTSFLSFAFVTLKQISRKSKATIYVFYF